MRARKRGFERAHFRRHQALGARTETHQQRIAGLQIRDALTTQGLHMAEDVIGPPPARHVANDDSPLKRTRTRERARTRTLTITCLFCIGQYDLACLLHLPSTAKPILAQAPSSLLETAAVALDCPGRFMGVRLGELCHGI